MITFLIHELFVRKQLMTMSVSARKTYEKIKKIDGDLLLVPQRWFRP